MSIFSEHLGAAIFFYVVMLQTLLENLSFSLNKLTLSLQQNFVQLII